MTLFVVPCGVSVLDGLARGVGAPHGGPNTEQLRAECVDWAARARRLPDGEVAGSWAQKFAALILRPTRLAEWDPVVAAETSTVQSRAPLGSLLADSHRVAILASDTDGGLAAAMIVGSRLVGDLNNLGYCTTPDQDDVAEWGYGFAARTITVVRIRHLDPRRAGVLPKATAGIGRALFAAYSSARGDAVEVHLTGGLKSTLLHTMTMTEVLRSRSTLKGGPAVSAWYLFDDNPGGDGRDTPISVEVGLRCFDEHTMNAMTNELSAVRDTRDGNIGGAGRAFEGVGWTRDERGFPRLTPFGTGFLAVLGEPVGALDRGA